MLILISSPPFVIGTQTSKATPSISRLRRLHLGRTLMALAGLVSGVLEWSLVYWLKHKTQGLQGLWATILPECPWMPLCSSFHLLHLGFWVYSGESHAIPHHQAGICFPCITLPAPFPGAGPLTLFSTSIGETSLKDWTLHLTFLLPNNPPDHLTPGLGQRPVRPLP